MRALTDDARALLERAQRIFEAQVGDLVAVTEGRPMSKLKRFHLRSIVKKAGS